MNTLFAKLFLWFWAAMLTIGAVLLLAQHYWQPDEGLPDERVMAEHASTLERLVEEEGFSSVPGYLRALNRQEDLRLALVTERGRTIPMRRLDPTMREHLAAIARDSSTGVRTVGHHRVRTHPVMLGTTPATLIALAPDRGIGDLPWWGRLFIALAVTAGLSALFARLLSAPVRRVREASRRLAAGELDTRVPESGKPGDDIAALAHDFNRMAERLQQLLDARNELLRDISHELRSPLARLQVAMALGRSRPDGAAFDRMEREIERMDALIGELLALARLEAGTMALREEPIDLSGLLSAICDDANFEAGASNKRVTLHQQHAVTLSGDPALLHSAFDNLVRNAIRHTPEGTEVVVSQHIDGAMTVVEVRDAGPGVPQPQLERIFEPFVRISGARERETGGHGLGLSIARRAVLAHGGTVHAENTTPTGLKVMVNIPLKPA